MRDIKIADCSLCARTEEGGFSLSFKERIEIAKELEKLGVSIIETGTIIDEKTDCLFLRTVSQLVKNSVLSSTVGMTAETVETAWQAISGAAKPRLCVSLPVSTVQMEYACGKKPAQILELIDELVRAAGIHTQNIEFAAEDATRSEPGFLSDAIGRAISAGAKTVTLCDSAGTMFPDEFAAFIDGVLQNQPLARDIDISVRCSDEMGMSCACAFATVAAGAAEMKTAASGAGTADLQTAANIFRTRGDSLGIRAGLDMTAVNKAVKRIRRLASDKRSSTSAFSGELFSTDSSVDISLDSTADIKVLEAALRKLGYDLSGEDLCRVFEAFSRIAAKKAVSAKELDVIVASSALQVPPTYKLISYVINSGNIINATAHIQINKDKETIRGLMSGDGPIDAAFLALEQIVGRHYELDDFQIQAVTEGREAMASSLIKLRSGGKLFSGQGISTDIIGAAIRAYIDAVNKISYEEKLGQ